MLMSNFINFINRVVAGEDPTVAAEHAGNASREDASADEVAHAAGKYTSSDASIDVEEQFQFFDYEKPYIKDSYG
jgi:hypothetical protein